MPMSNYNLKQHASITINSTAKHEERSLHSKRPGCAIVRYSVVVSPPARRLGNRTKTPWKTWIRTWKENKTNTLPETSIAHENHHLPWKIPSKWWFFHGYVSLQEGTIPETNSKSTRKWMVGILLRSFPFGMALFSGAILVSGSVHTL